MRKSELLNCFLTFTTLRANSVDDKFMINGDNLHEMSNPVFKEK